MAKPVNIFFSYAHKDEKLMNAVRQQLIIFERRGDIAKHYDRQIPPGTQWQGAIDNFLFKSQVILLFISPYFIESRYCYDVEVTTALERHESGEARVIPIILRPCAWQDAPFGQLEVLPADGKPVTSWRNRDAVCLSIAQEIMNVVSELQAA